jgi:membrane protein
MRPLERLSAATTAIGVAGLLVALVREPEARPPATPRAAGRPAGTAAAPGEGGGSGRTAETPSQIPARGWWQIAKRTAAEVSRDRVMTEAAGVTFYALLAIFPALASLISLYGLVADPATVSEHLSSLEGVLPGGGIDIIREQVQTLTSGPPKALGFGAILGLATSVWSANQGIKALFDALNVVNEERETRGFVRRTLLTLSFTVGALLFVLLALAATVVVPAVLAFVGLSDAVETLLNLARWPVLLLAVALFLALVYRFGPDRARPKWRWVTWGSGLAALAWLAGSAAFSWYVANFGSYNKTYGSLGAVVGFMTWIWISTIIVLVGAELNAEMEHQTERDSTSGPGEAPPGARGAAMADRVA